MYRYIYKITCTAGSFKDKFYYGQHTTSNLDDGYKGSGKLIQDYYKQYPLDYIKEIICFCESQEELNKLEYNVIHQWLGNPLCLNICEGGIGSGFTHHTEETKKRLSESHKGKSPANKGKPAWNRGQTGIYHLSNEAKKKISEVHKGRKYSLEHNKNLSNSLKGHVLSEETKKKISDSHKRSYIKRMWINKDDSEILIPIIEYQKYIAIGWSKGRK